MKHGLALAGAAAAILAALTMFAAQLTADPPPAPAGAAVPTAPTTSQARFFRELGNTDPGPSIEIALDDAQALIVDSALRAVMDYYLLDRSDEGRMQALRLHLQRRLPQGAAQEATQLAERYNTYLGAHDALLVAQNFVGAPDPGRLASWQQQRRQLRIRMLGERVTEEWFGTEDAYLTQALDEARRPQDTAPSSGEEIRHRQHMQQVLREAVSSASAAPRYAPPSAN